MRRVCEEVRVIIGRLLEHSRQLSQAPVHSRTFFSVSPRGSDTLSGMGDAAASEAGYSKAQSTQYSAGFHGNAGTSVGSDGTLFPSPRQRRASEPVLSYATPSGKRNSNSRRHGNGAAAANTASPSSGVAGTRQHRRHASSAGTLDSPAAFSETASTASPYGVGSRHGNDGRRHRRHASSLDSLPYQPQSSSNTTTISSGGTGTSTQSSSSSSSSSSQSSHSFVKGGLGASLLSSDATAVSLCGRLVQLLQGNAHDVASIVNTDGVCVRALVLVRAFSRLFSMCVYVCACAGVCLSLRSCACIVFRVYGCGRARARGCVCVRVRVC